MVKPPPSFLSFILTVIWKIARCSSNLPLRSGKKSDNMVSFPQKDSVPRDERWRL
jgi:hypothetical protein